MPKTLEGKRALITGSSKGIGRATAIRFAREGAKVAVHGRDEEDLNETLAMIRDAGGEGACLTADLGAAETSRRLVERAIEAFGGLDVLVNNAGMQMEAPFEEVSEEDWDRVIHVDLRAPFFAAQAFVRHLKAKKRGGVIVNVSSVHEELPFPCYSTYAVAKGGMGMLTRTLGAELAGTGIRVAGIAPGAIRAGENAQMDEAQRRKVAENIPLGRVAEPEEVAAAIAFLAGEDGRYVHGTTLFVDGGLTWQYQE